MVCLNGIKKTTSKPMQRNAIYFLSPFSNKEMTLANYKIASSNSEELLGVVIDSEVTFAKHIENLCRKTNQKLHALARVANFMTLEKRRLVMKTFVFFPI